VILRDRLQEIALHRGGVGLDRRRVVAKGVHLFARHHVRVQLLASVEVDDRGVRRDDAPLAHETVHRGLAGARDGEVVRDAELCDGGSSSQ